MTEFNAVDFMNELDDGATISGFEVPEDGVIYNVGDGGIVSIRLYHGSEVIAFVIERSEGNHSMIRVPNRKVVEVWK